MKGFFNKTEISSAPDLTLLIQNNNITAKLLPSPEAFILILQNH